MSYSKKRFGEGDDAALPRVVAGDFKPVIRDEMADIPDDVYEEVVKGFAPRTEPEAVEATAPTESDDA